MLADTENYTFLKDGNKDETIIEKIGKLLNKFENETTKAEKDYINYQRYINSQSTNKSNKEQNSEYIKLPCNTCRFN